MNKDDVNQRGWGLVGRNMIQRIQEQKFNTEKINNVKYL